MTPSLYQNLFASVTSYAKVFGASNQLEIFDWDAHASLEEIPKKDLIGPMEFEMSSDDGMLSIMGMIAISTYEDTNLFRLRDKVGLLFDRMQPTKLMDLKNAGTNVKIGTLIIKNGTAVLPVERAKTRPIMAVAFSASTDYRMHP